MPSPSSLATFGVIAMALALCWLLASAAAAGVSGFLGRRRAMQIGLRRAPAAFIVRERESIDGRVWRLANASLVFATTGGLLVGFGADDIAPVLPAWHLWSGAAMVAGAAGYSVVSLARLIRYRRRLCSLIEKNAATAGRLEEVQVRGHRVFCAVPVADRVIDYVVVGSNGVFAVQVVMAGRPGATGVRMAHGVLHFLPAHGQLRLARVTEAFAGLARELGRTIGRPVKIVPMLVAPGCRIASQDDPHYLVSDEKNCVALVGWKDPAAYLMDDEIARMTEWLGARCRPKSVWTRRPWGRPPHVCLARDLDAGTPVSRG